ncbi:hypothetical protein SB6419_01201 [Klebsiella spallanzanii]|nr:hypothetical protein SB6419_01201 [Klebsiella spallanzanii]
MSDESPVFEKIPVGTGELFTLRVDNINNFNGINVVPHYHMMDELMWFRESGGSYSIGDEKFTIKNNTLVFVPALLIHEMTLPPAAASGRNPGFQRPLNRPLESASKNLCCCANSISLSIC